MNRREFLTTATAATAALSLTAAPVRAQGRQGRGQGRGQAPIDTVPDPAVIAKAHGTWSMFSRHLQYVSTQAQTTSDPFGTGVKIGEQAMLIGVGAVNLTVRNSGHVEPANVATALAPMLKGIRSTGITCEMMTTGISPSADPQNTDWITSQSVVALLSAASASGIRKYRIGGGGGYPANAFGKAITDYLDGYRVNMDRLVAYNKQYDIRALFHTQGAIGTSLWDLMYVWKDIDPKYISFNYCPGHVVENSLSNGPTSVWANNLRYVMPYLGGLALQDVALTINSDGTLSWRTPLSGKGQVNWVVLFQLLREGGHIGLLDTQEEYPITASDGSVLTMNSTWFGDNAVITSGRLTPALLLAAMKNDMDFYKARAAEAGWTAAQMTP